MRYGKDDYLVVCSKDDVKRKPSKHRAAEVSIEDRKFLRCDGDQVNQPIQFIQKPNCGSDAPLGIPDGGFVGVPLRRRVEANGPSHQPLSRLRS